MQPTAAAVKLYKDQNMKLCTAELHNFSVPANPMQLKSFVTSFYIHNKFDSSVLYHVQDGGSVVYFFSFLKFAASLAFGNSTIYRSIGRKALITVLKYPKTHISGYECTVTYYFTRFI